MQKATRIEGAITAPRGYRAAGVAAGFKKSGAPDLALIVSDRPAMAAGAFTKNVFAAAPVRYDRRILAAGQPVQAVLVNSGNANACTGAQGDRDVNLSAAYTAKTLDLAPEQVLISSTGRIGVPLPMDRIRKGIDLAAKALSEDGGLDAAQAIMTTDTRPKHIAVELPIGGQTVRIGGITKGAGMIAPALRLCPAEATMLSYISTDAAIQREALEAAVSEAIELSFNRITVDGDMSTNDTLVVMANAAAENAVIVTNTPAYEAFRQALIDVLAHLAREMVLDGEGVTRFVELTVRGALSDADARTCAEAIANSVLCKTAWFGADPNWGRILCAAGYSGIQIDPDAVSLTYGNVPIVRNGVDAGSPVEAQIQAIDRREFGIELDLGLGDGAFTVWTCDLTYEYVKINADYHT